MTTPGGTTTSNTSETSTTAFTYYELSPTSGPAGTKVTITGADFGNTDSEVSTVLFGTADATNLTHTSGNETTITCDAPAGTGKVDVYLTYISTGSADMWLGNTYLIGTYTYPAPTYTVTYEANNTNVTGSAPVDPNSPYTSGANVTVLGNVGSPPMAVAGYAFGGWNTAVDGTGTSYAAGATISDITSSITLYAVWTANP